MCNGARRRHTISIALSISSLASLSMRITSRIRPPVQMCKPRRSIGTLEWPEAAGADGSREAVSLAATGMYNTAVPARTVLRSFKSAFMLGGGQ